MKKSPNKVVVRNSYYTFSRDYPAGQIHTVRRRSRPRDRRKLFLRILLGVVLFCAVFCLSFFWTDLSLKISNRADAQENSAEAVTDENGVVRTVLSNGSLRALSLSAETIRDRSTVRQSIKQLRRKDCSAVILDFKDRDGRLLFASLEPAALLAKASLYSNDTVRTAIKQYRNAGFSVLARFYCFEDPLIAGRNPDYAVTYMDTQVPWLDKKAEDGGKAWLNPYSGKARSYLLKLLQETQAFAVDGVILESVCFPQSDNIDTATFPGESGGAVRSGVLKRFLEKAKAVLPESRILLVGISADDLRHGNADRYDGRLDTETANGVLVHTAGAVDAKQRPKDYDAQVNAFSTLESRVSPGRAIMLELPVSEVTRKYLRALEKEGFRYLVIGQDDDAATEPPPDTTEPTE